MLVRQVLPATTKGPFVDRIDLVSGDRSILSSADVGAGPVFSQPTGIAIVVPEPAAIALLASAWRDCSATPGDGAGRATDRHNGASTTVSGTIFVNSPRRRRLSEESGSPAQVAHDEAAGLGNSFPPCSREPIPLSHLLTTR